MALGGGERHSVWVQSPSPSSLPLITPAWFLSGNRPFPPSVLWPGSLTPTPRDEHMAQAWPIRDLRLLRTGLI